MTRRFLLLVLSAALGFGVLQAQSQQPGSSSRGGQAPTTDAHANNPDAGTINFPLAAPAGKDSGAITKAPAGAFNQGTIDEKTWKYGHAFDPPPNAKIWNPVKLKLMRGEKVTGGTVSSASDPSTYCAMANAGYDFIGTVGGAAQAREIAAIPGVDAVFAASSDLGNFSGYKQGDPDYERLINVVHDAALAAGKRLCGPFAWRDRPDFTCFQAGSETAALARGAAAELGDLKDTQGKPEVGPYAPKK